MLWWACLKQSAWTQQAPDYASNWGPTSFRVIWRFLMVLGIPCAISTGKGPITYVIIVMQETQGGHGSVRLRFGGGRVRAVPVFGSGGSSAKKRSFCVSVQFNRKGRFRFRFRFLENGSGGSGSAFGCGKNSSDGSGSRFRFGSWATLERERGGKRESQNLPKRSYRQIFRWIRIRCVIWPPSMDKSCSTVSTVTQFESFV